MERLTDSKTATDLKANYESLRAAGQPRDWDIERYIKLAEYEDIEEIKKRYEKPEILYECDPNKNLKCKKTGCFTSGRECRLTQYKEYAMTDENGDVIKEGD